MVRFEVAVLCMVRFEVGVYMYGQPSWVNNLFLLVFNAICLPVYMCRQVEYIV